MSTPSFSCSCGGLPGKNRWEVAKRWAESGGTIFEGRVIAVKLHMKVLEANEGDWIPAGFEPSYTDDSRPYTSATIEVTRSYSRDLGKTVEVRSGLGGGDCGFQFEVGEDYIVFAGGNSSVLWTSICSATARVSDNTTELRYLRGQQPTSDDLEPFWAYRNSNKPVPPHTPPRRPTGSICGEIKGIRPGDPGFMQFQSATGTLGFPRTWDARLDENGHFCSEPLKPGRYIAFYEKSIDGLDVATRTYFPGTTVRKQAQEINVQDGQTEQANFRAFWLRTQSVDIYVGANDIDKASLELAQAMLIRLDGESLMSGYSEIFPQNRWMKWMKRVRISHVLPGRYAVFIMAGRDLMMQKRIIMVADRSQSILVKLKRNEKAH
jgi:hypothetical protein